MNIKLILRLGVLGLLLSSLTQNLAIAQDSSPTGETELTPKISVDSSPTLSVSKKDYVLPAFEIVGFQILLNLFNRNFASDSEEYESDFNTIHENLTGGWAFDRDSFSINQVGHPYQGSIYYNLARSSGLNFWESLGYTAGGSVLWEIAGETTNPSVNDQITTTFGGGFFGEALFRTAETFFKSGERTASVTPDVNATIVAPAADFNKKVFDREVTPDLDKQRPVIFRELQLGYKHANNVFNAFDEESVDRNMAVARFNIDYGLPGKPGYLYDKPFDYYNMDVGLNSGNSEVVEHLLVNGMLFGKKYEAGGDYRGIYGLFGNYNYISPQIFRVASTALSLGSVGQWRLSKGLALQGSLMGGAGFGAAGTAHQTDTGREYHYGAVPQALMSLRFIMGDVAFIDLSGQEFLVAGQNSDPSGSSSENISRVQVALTTRVYGPHAVGINYSEARRNAPFDNSPDQHQRFSAVGVFYTYLWGESVGRVDWTY